MGKITYGINRVAYAPKTLTGYDTYIPIIGALSWSHSEEGESTAIEADNNPTYCVTPFIEAITGELGIRFIDRDFETYALGMFENANGVDTNTGQRASFALTLEITEYDCEVAKEDPIIITYYNVKAGVREWETTSKASTTEAGEITLPFTMGSSDVLDDKNDPATYSKFRISATNEAWYTQFKVDLMAGTAEVITPQTTFTI